jgi:uncharacterized protein (TIGR03435 family)
MVKSRLLGAVGIVAVVTLSAVALFAQDITGNWQGTLQTQGGQALRVVIKVSPDGAALRAVMYSIDQGGQPIAGTVTLQGSAVKMSVPALTGTLDGRLSADGATITGSWTQNGGPQLTLNLVHVTADAAWAIPAVPAPLKPMAANANPAFEVATLKPSKPDALGRGFRVQGRQFSTLNTSLSDMISFAYGLHARQITGAPAWLEQDKYDVLGEPDTEGQPSGDQWKMMLQKMLADRFKLSFHRDKKELSVYAIVVADKIGPKLAKSESNGNTIPALIFRGLGNLPARNATMTEFANVMQSAVLDRPVVDQTGLSGRFDFTLIWTPDQSQFGGRGVPAPTDDPNAPPGLFTAIQEQLGLKLDSTKAPVDVLVIDSVEHPTAD